MRKRDRSEYLAEEVAAMAEAGYVTPRAAAAESGVHVDRVYRAIKAGLVAARSGANEYARYVRRADWLRLIAARRRRTMRALGVK